MIIRASTRRARGPRPCRDCICSTQVIDEPKLRAARSGRLGFTFVVIAMRCWQAACQMFLPNRTTQRELDIQKRRDPAAEKEDIWNPNAWKRFVGRRPGGAFASSLGLVAISRCRG